MYTLIEDYSATSQYAAIGRRGSQSLCIGSSGMQGRIWVGYTKMVTGYSNPDIFVAYSDDIGKTWTKVQLTDDNSVYRENVSIAVDSNDVIHITYTQGSLPQYIYYITNAGGSWSTPAQLTEGSVQSRNCQILIDGNDEKILIYYDTHGEHWAIFERRTIGGVWQDPTYILDTAGDQQGKFATIDTNGYLHLFYRYFREPYHFDIYYATNQTGVWVPTVIMYTDSNMTVVGNIITSHDGSIYGMFCPFTPILNSSIMYWRKNPDGFEHIYPINGQINEGPYDLLRISSSPANILEVFYSLGGNDVMRKVRTGADDPANWSKAYPIYPKKWTVEPVGAIHTVNAYFPTNVWDHDGIYIDYSKYAVWDVNGSIYFSCTDLQISSNWSFAEIL